MPATRARTRILEERKSSDPATSPSELPMPEFNFAPNVTPLTYTCDSETADEDNSSPECLDMSEMRFPPSSSKPNSARRRRKNDGKIPRPPNAFMLFRSEFVRQQHIPGSIETNRTSLSKIIGVPYRLLLEIIARRRESSMVQKGKSGNSRTQAHISRLSFSAHTWEEEKGPNGKGAET
ncbi:hypothetical protein GYMLUDRAFT_606744 [Collybiopsis luxurians FD-317 M1]|uniref:Unplaced genomic scaffold GYMLUscaffold_27, whole genome shotgun sequence n=1 Tax=Collybiopsis luxurians FD-317 M1 TaxID=944289 RepID=A0A0D0CWC5_9AGAR|nr:hypothetical protein GYMLUDRAFT_606744 [Collybiopsis luxurians FD-317 M1]